MKRRTPLLVALCLSLLACVPTPTPAVPTALPTAPPPSASTPPSATPVPPAVPSPSLPPSLPPATATPAALTYTVRAGDTLFAIALAYDVTLDSLRAVNGLEGDFIFVGQTLIIPSGTVVPPTVAASPTRPDSLEVVAFAASPNPVDRGAAVTVAWDVPFALKVTLFPMTFDRKTGRWHRLSEEFPGYPLTAPVVSSDTTGQWTGVVPEDARYSFRFELEARDIDGRLVTGTTEEVELVCHASIAGGGYCPFSPSTVAGEYQAFEMGHLIWRSDTDQILIIPSNPAYYLPWSLEAALPNAVPVAEPPPGRFAPGERFAGLWASFPVATVTTGAATPEQRLLLLSEVLGWATSPAQAYDLSIQIDLDDTQSGIFNDHLYMTLPDGRIASLTLYNGAQGATGPAWSFVEP